MIIVYFILGVACFIILGITFYGLCRIFWKTGFDELERVLNKQSIKLKKNDTTQK
jgi:transcriptional regulatory protein LevR